MDSRAQRSFDSTLTFGEDIVFLKQTKKQIFITRIIEKINVKIEKDSVPHKSLLNKLLKKEEGTSEVVDSQMLNFDFNIVIQKTISIYFP